MTTEHTTQIQETPQATKSCDALGILAIVFAILALIPFIGWFFFAAALVLAIISVVQGKKKAVCGRVGLGLTIAVAIFKIILLVGFMGVGTKLVKEGVETAMQELPYAIAKEQLPSTITYLEEYKTTFGDYPAKLADLQEISDEAVEGTIDPMGITNIMAMAFRGEEINEENALELMPQFYYEKLENGYYLFSKGKDQKEFTADDIMPDMAVVSSEVGLQLP